MPRTASSCGRWRSPLWSPTRGHITCSIETLSNGSCRCAKRARSRFCLAGPRPLAPDSLAEVDRIVAAAFPSVRATDDLRRQAATWGERERFIVERLDGKTSAETIAALWTDGNPTSMVAAQVKVFCDQLAEWGLLD